MNNLNWYLQQARRGGYAVAHFNFSSAEQLKAVVEGFQKARGSAHGKELALMVGTSEGESKFLGYKKARALVNAWVDETGTPIFLNADHHKSFETAKLAIDAGYDSILIDASKIPFGENTVLTQKVVEYAKSVSDNRHAEITIEGELGYLKGESQIQDTIEITVSDFTKPDEAEKFVKETGVDRLAVAAGNIHGITTDQEMKLDFELIKKIADIVGKTYLVLHGGSGLTPDDFKKAIEAGVANIHINTEVRAAYRKGIEEKLKESPNEVAPYKFLDKAVSEMSKVVEEKIKIFSGLF